MTLTGFKPIAGKLSGGIDFIALVPAKSIKDISFDYSNNSIKEIRLLEDYNFQFYLFKEASASYQENIAYSSGRYSVLHRLTFFLERFDCNTRKAIEEIIGFSDKGLIAFIETINGSRNIIGISQKFGKERPLKIATVEGKTGFDYSDANGENIILESIDSSKALEYTGESFKPESVSKVLK